LQKCSPVNFYGSAYQSLDCDPALVFYACPDRADRTGAPLAFGNPRNNTINSLPNKWLNPAAFAVPALGNIGNASRNPFYGPGINYSDLALHKDVHLTESTYFRVRLELSTPLTARTLALPSIMSTTRCFGEILGVQLISTNGDGRVLQLAGKFYF